MVNQYTYSFAVKKLIWMMQGRDSWKLTGEALVLQGKQSVMMMMMTTISYGHPVPPAGSSASGKTWKTGTGVSWSACGSGSAAARPARRR